ncbi:MAG: hypothetical protein CM15mP98_10210 [Paracoccaceae bacterium]|nr:MAG: hypothetical protein CM15mP98_10210 [Paracoccaceae bacterium]
MHIEQGPILHHENKALGIVSSISGIEILYILKGKRGHAGTVPMHLRKDALSGAAKIISKVESLAILNMGVATVGSINTKPNAVMLFLQK